MELFLRLLATVMRVLLPPLSHSIQAYAHRDWMLSLGLAAFCNGVPTEHYREVHAIIRFLKAKGNTPIEIHYQLTEVYGESCMEIKNIRKWCREFAFGYTQIHDDKPSGRSSTCNETVKVEETMRKDERVSLDDLCVSNPEVSRTTIYRIFKDKLQYREVCATWVPRMLTEDHKRQRVDSAHEFLLRYADEKDNILD